MMKYDKYGQVCLIIAYYDYAYKYRKRPTVHFGQLYPNVTNYGHTIVSKCQVWPSLSQYGEV